MQTGQVVVQYPGFDLGLNDTSGADMLLPAELRVLKNLYAAERGELLLRGGRTAWSAADEPEKSAGNGLFEVRTITGDVYQIKFLQSKVYYLSAATWVDITGTAAFSDSADTPWSVCEHNGRVYAVNGGQPIMWDLGAGGFAPYDPTNAPATASTVWSAFGRLWFGGVGLPCYAQHSNLDAVPIWTAGDLYAFGPRQGSLILGGREVDGIFYGFSRPRGRFLMTQTADLAPYFSIQEFDADSGCASAETIRRVGDFLIYQDAGGDVRAWDMRADSLGRAQRNLSIFQRRLLHEEMDLARLPYNSAIYVPWLRQYWLLLTRDISRAATEHNAILALRIPESIPFSGSNPEVPLAPAYLYTYAGGLARLDLWLGSDGQMRPVGIDYDGVVYDLWAAGGDSGAAIPFEARLGINPFGEPGVEKRVYWIGTTFQQPSGGEVTVEVAHVLEGVGTVDRQEVTVREAGVPIGRFTVGRHSIGRRGRQREFMAASGIGERSEIRYRGEAAYQFGLSLPTLGFRSLRSPKKT